MADALRGSVVQLLITIGAGRLGGAIGLEEL
jgi:hypothetical protein